MLKTYQTKLSKVSEYPMNSILISYLNDWSKYFESIERKLFVDMVHRKAPISVLKKQYLNTYNITARQFNSIKAQLQGKINSIKELKKSELEKKSIKLKQLKNKLIILVNDKKKIQHSINTTKINDKHFSRLIKKYKYIKLKIHYTKRKIQEIFSRISRIKSDIEKDIVRICFGSKKLFKQQYYLKENGFKNHDEWKSRWIKARSNQSMCLGSSDETFGNQNCQYDKDNNLTIRIANKFEHIYGKYIVVPNVLFKYGQDNIDYCKETYKSYTKSGNPQRYYNSAITHRFYRNEFGWYLYTTVEVKDKPITTDSKIGAIGVDFNVNFAQLCFVDRFGNPLDELSIKYSMYGKTANQITAMLGDLSRDICELGRYYKIPIYIENLKLEDTKNCLDKGVKYNRMINSFPYKKFREFLESRGKKTGVEIIAVSPKYTSIIGQFKFMKKYGLSSHGSAACIIARKGLRFKTEKLSKKNKIFLKQSSNSINLNKDNYKLWIRLSFIIKNRYKFNDRVKLIYSNIL